MFLAKSGEYESCGLFSAGHFVLIVLTVTGIVVALKNTVFKSKEEIKRIIRGCTIFVWIFEIIMIAFKISINKITNVNSYIPLYYCSLLLYAGALSSFGKEKVQKLGDIFIATGGIIGGIVFIFFPTTSLPAYPTFHLVSIHSFIFHGIMIYLGLLLNITNYVEIKKKDIIYYMSLVGIICLLAYIVNNIFGSNLMFISKNFPGMPIEIIYNLSGKYFTLVMSIGQMTLPFMIVYSIRKWMTSKKFYMIEQEDSEYCKVNT